MGIYPNEKTERFLDIELNWKLRRTLEVPGLVTVEVYGLESTEETRTDCFCCTCADEGGADGACRNHGYYGKRPCDIHNMPGEEWEDTDTMPESVLTIRKKNGHYAPE